LTNRARAGGCADSNYPFLTGKERDSETGLDYFNARYYSSTQGRFTSPDEFTGGPDEYYEFHDLASQNPTFYADLTDPQSLNKYQYCYNNPLLYIDPDGHQGVREWFRNTLNGAASTVSENNGFGRMDAPQTTTGRVIGHIISLAQSGAEVVGGVATVVGGGGEAVITSPAAGTGVGVVIPAAGVVTVVAGAVVTVQALPLALIRSTTSSARTTRIELARTSQRRVSQDVIEQNKAQNDGTTRCNNCGTETVPGQQGQNGVPKPANETQVDHIKPKSRGGQGRPDNGQVLCRTCNQKKSNKIPE